MSLKNAFNAIVPSNNPAYSPIEPRALPPFMNPLYLLPPFPFPFLKCRINAKIFTHGNIFPAKRFTVVHLENGIVVFELFSEARVWFYDISLAADPSEGLERH
jgi:hypothetical protein